jgi:hydroxymethylpyrimidine/phosphomethylpyrimidine kinase
MPYRTAPGPRPGLLIVAGLDPSGGAGLIADVRIADRLGCRPIGVATSLTEQSTRGVQDAHHTQSHIIASQLTLVLSDIEIRAVKIGMIATARTARDVADALALTGAPVVWDPVLSPTRGGALYDGDPMDAIAALAAHLALITPNADEAHRLTGIAVTDEKTAIAAGRALVKQWVSAALIKGGHVEGAEAVDILVEGDQVHRLPGLRIPAGASVHGTGCALSTAIACRLAHGDALVDACRIGKSFVADLLAAPVSAGRGDRSVL